MRVESIFIDEINVGSRRREDYGDIDGLADSIARYGLLQPIVVDADLNLIAGGRRLKAFQKLGRDEIHARFYSELSEDERRTLELEENIRRKDLTSYEKSRQLTTNADTVETLISSVADEIKTPNKNPKNAGRKSKRSVPKDDVAKALGVSKSTLIAAEQHVAAVKQYPELAATGIPQKDAIAIADNLNKMPENERNEARSRFIAGDTNTRAQLANKPPVPPPLPKRGKSPADKWNSALAETREILSALRKFGGVSHLIANWSPEQIEGLRSELTEFRAELDGYISELGESSDELRLKVG